MFLDLFLMEELPSGLLDEHWKMLPFQLQIVSNTHTCNR